MSDEPSRADGAPPRTPSGIWEHLCEHPGCAVWGAWGFARGKRTAWFCFEHRPDE